MTESTKSLSEFLEAFSHHQEVVSTNQARLFEESEAFRRRTAKYHMAIDHSNAELDARMKKFFRTAEIDVFTCWETAAPLYRAGWNKGRISVPFEMGLKNLVKKQDTYIYEDGFSWTCDPADSFADNPVKNIHITIPEDVDDEKLARTAVLAESLFLPMTNAYPGLTMTVEFDARVETVGISLDKNGEYQVRTYNTEKFVVAGPVLLDILLFLIKVAEQAK